MLTTRQRAYALAVSNGASSGQAVRMAGYVHTSDASLRTQASRLARLPAIQQEIYLERQKRLQGPLASKALACLESILGDESAPQAARIQAAKWVLEGQGFGLEARRLSIRHPEEGDRSLAGMSVSELEAMCRSAETTLKLARGQVIDAEGNPQTDPADSEEGDDE